MRPLFTAPLAGGVKAMSFPGLVARGNARLIV